MRNRWSVPFTVVVGLVAMIAIPALATGGTPVFDRGLPEANLNNGAGSDRSNVAWAFGEGWITGDDFTVGAPGEVWVVTEIRTWSVGGSPTDVNAFGHEIGDRFESVTLYGGLTDASLSPLATGTLTSDSNLNSNPNIIHAPVTYAGGAHYQGTSGAMIRIWENRFTGLGWVVPGGTKVYFAVDGALRTGVDYYWFNHASNAGKGGVTADGSDDRYLAWDLSDLGSGAFECDSASGPCKGWDKSSDINVQVLASQVATTAEGCKRGAWARLVRADGSPFKNQGDCVSYVKTGK